VTGAPDMDGIVVHVGMHKTGTSAFQAALTARAEALARAGLAAVTPTTPELAGGGRAARAAASPRSRRRGRGARAVSSSSHENLSIWDGWASWRAARRPRRGTECARVLWFRHWDRLALRPRWGASRQTGGNRIL
jgi:hypothetical protein